MRAKHLFSIFLEVLAHVGSVRPSQLQDMKRRAILRDRKRIEGKVNEACTVVDSARVS